MADEYRRRSTDSPHGERLATLEAQMKSVERRFAEHMNAEATTHADLVKLVEKIDSRAEALDTRQNESDVRFARLIAVLGTLWAVTQFATPIVLRALGLPS